MFPFDDVIMNEAPWPKVYHKFPSIRNPILFNVFINDIFFLDWDCDIYSYADDRCISYSMTLMFLWTGLNKIRWRQIRKKFQSMLISSHICDIDGWMIPVGNTTLSSMERIKVLGIMIDDMLNFSEHISNVCINVGWQQNVLPWLKIVLDYKSRIAIYNSFVMSITVLLTGCLLARGYLKKREYLKTHLVFCSEWLSIKLSWSVKQEWSYWN